MSIAQAAATVGTLAIVCAFFGFLLLWAADPFAISAKIPLDGDGLNPMLRDPAMIAHPPLLFLGYAGFTIPFAIMVGSLFSGKRDDYWTESARHWVIFSFLALTAGILLGAKWAYVELGWGGYWAWDPVENASLLPWLTGVALIHSLIVQRQRGMLRIWTAALLLITFALCIFGTYVTRSGVVDSVHSFGQSLVGTFFLVMMLCIGVAGIGLLIWRRKLLISDHELTGLIGREGAFLAANILLVAMTTIVLVGTMFPVISGHLSGTRTTLQPQFYDRVAGPIGLLVALFMATGPLLTYGENAAKSFIRGLPIPATMAAVAAIVVYLLGIHNPWAIACAIITTSAFAIVAIDILRHRRGFLAHHRRYGAQIAHLGLILIIVGITGSSVFSTKQSFQLNPGDTAQFSGLQLKLNDLTQNATADCTTITAAITATDVDGHVIALQPQRRFFKKWDDQPNSVVAIDSAWTRDLYVTLAGWNENGKDVAIEAIINPLVCWIWIGGCMLIAGGLVSLMPWLVRSPAVVADATPAPQITIGLRKPQLGRLS